MVQVTFGLLLVLAMIGGLAWAIARLGRFGRFGPASTAAVRVIAAASVGPRERVAVVEVGGQWLVLGVAPGCVNLLDKTTPQPAAADPLQGQGHQQATGSEGATPMSSTSLPPLPPFAAWLQRALNRKQD